MGSTKHIRNNGEHLNIHGHDNYQMPGAYKQMGDMNKNQPAKYDDGPKKELVGKQKTNLSDELKEAIIQSDQPGKISGGAAAYIRKSYGADKADYDKDMAEERIQIKDDKEKIYQDDKEKKESYGAGKIDDPETDPSPPTPAETAKSINKFSKSVYDAGYNTTRGRGGYANADGTSLGFDESARRKSKPGLPKGVFQDYLNSGGNTNPRVAKDILSKAAKFATSETGMKNFVRSNAHSNNRAHYSPSEQFRGVDTQTGKAKTFMNMGNSPEVTKHSDAFQKNMRFGINLSNSGGGVSNIKTKGISSSSSLTADLSGLKPKEVIKNTNPNTKSTKRERYQEVKSIFKSNRRKSKRNSK